MPSRPLPDLRRKATRWRRSRSIGFSQLLRTGSRGRICIAVHGKTAFRAAYPDGSAERNAGTSTQQETSCALLVKHRLFQSNWLWPLIGNVGLLRKNEERRVGK